jgi:hypothetical protein
MDERPAQRIAQDTLDELNHLAKVRVAGSNPVFRSISPGESPFLNLCHHLGSRGPVSLESTRHEGPGLSLVWCSCLRG